MICFKYIPLYYTTYRRSIDLTFKLFLYKVRGKFTIDACLARIQADLVKKENKQTIKHYYTVFDLYVTLGVNLESYGTQIRTAVSGDKPTEALKGHWEKKKQ